MSDRNNQLITVIYGAGALGWALTADSLLGLGLGNYNRFVDPTLIGVTKSKNFDYVRFHSVSLSIEVCLEHIQTARSLDNVSHHLLTHRDGPFVIVITVPPHFLDQAVTNSLDFLTGISSDSLRRCCLLIAANGVVSESNWRRCTLFSRANPGFRVLRLIVIAGFWAQLSEDSPTLTVEHTSGRKVFWGDVDHSEENLPPAPVLSGPIFLASRVDKIRQVEYQKGFVNAVLGWWIGPSRLPNSSLSIHLSSEEAKLLAHCYIGLFPEAGPLEGLCQKLWETVAETGSNINSVSRSWAAGDPELANYFRNLIADAARDHKSPIQLGEGLMIWRRKFDQFSTG